MNAKTKAETNGNAGDVPDLDIPDIAAILADPSGSRMDELHQWMDATKEEMGFEDSPTARHDALFDTAITGLADLVRMSPHDEMERMIATQLVAAHAATMDCYRRSRTSHVEERRENLNQANKLSRVFVMLLGALQRHHGKVHRRGASRVVPYGSYSPPHPEARAKVAAQDASGTAETGARAPAADTKSEKQPRAQPTAPPLAPGRPSAPPAQAASVSVPALSAKTEKQPHATATAPAVKAAAELSAEVERLTRVVDDALARRRKSEE